MITFDESVVNLYRDGIITRDEALLNLRDTGRITGIYSPPPPLPGKAGLFR